MFVCPLLMHIRWKISISVSHLWKWGRWRCRNRTTSISTDMWRSFPGSAQAAQLPSRTLAVIKDSVFSIMGFGLCPSQLPVRPAHSGLDEPDCPLSSIIVTHQQWLLPPGSSAFQHCNTHLITRRQWDSNTMVADAWLEGIWLHNGAWWVVREGERERESVC